MGELSKFITKTSSKRVLVFGIVAIVITLLYAVAKQNLGLKISATLLYGFASVLAGILYLDSIGYKKFVNTAIVITANVILVTIAFAEGLKSGGYLFILPIIFALVFIMSNTREYKIEVFVNFSICIASFIGCVLFVPDQSDWQLISNQLYATMFIAHTITVVLLCTLFAYVGIYYERQIINQLVEEKTRAEIQEKKLTEFNIHLRELAHIGSYSVRAPLTNIIGIAEYIEELGYDKKDEEFLLNSMKDSARELDGAIHKMVKKTGSMLKAS